jgi:hypothetical protein
MPISPPDSTLQAIQIKVRRLTRSPSTAQLSDMDLNNYINTFLVYDFPEHLRTFNLKQQFSFICNPYQDTYPTDEISFAGVTTNPLYNFQNNYISIHPPVYMAGYDSFYTQSREEFYGIYPLLNSIASIGTTGDGVSNTFSGYINTQQTNIPPGVQQFNVLLQNNVTFTSIDANNNGLSLIDVPVINTATGNPTSFGNLYPPSALPSTPPITVDGLNYINYVTGQFNLYFSGAVPGPNQSINSQTVPVVPSRPQAMLYYQDTFYIRPVPDQPYRINFEVYVRPTALLSTSQSPQLEEWWQFIAYGAAKKVLEDRLDMDSVALILPEYRKQENLVLRKTIVQNTNERVATIYTDQTNNGNGPFGWGWPGGSF